MKYDDIYHSSRNKNMCFTYIIITPKNEFATLTIEGEVIHYE